MRRESRRRSRCRECKCIAFILFVVYVYLYGLKTLYKTAAKDQQPAPSIIRTDPDIQAAPIEVLTTEDLIRLAEVAALDIAREAVPKNTSQGVVAVVVGLAEMGADEMATMLVRWAKRLGTESSLRFYASRLDARTLLKTPIPLRGIEKAPLTVSRLEGMPVPFEGVDMLWKKLALSASRVHRAATVVLAIRHPLPWAISWLNAHPKVNITVVDMVTTWVQTVSQLSGRTLSTKDGVSNLAFTIAHVEATRWAGPELLDALLAPSLYTANTWNKNNIQLESSDYFYLPSRGFNAGIVRCWLRGVPFGDFKEACAPGEDRLRTYEFSNDTIAESAARHLEFWRVKHAHECDMDQYGYTMRVFESLLACGHSCGRAVRAARAAPPVFADLVHPEIEAISPIFTALSTHAARQVHGQNTESQEDRAISADWPAPDSMSAPQFLEAVAKYKGDVIVAFYKLFNNARSSGEKGGMFARMAQVVHALDAAGYRVHFICHCDMVPPREIDMSWAPDGTRFYEGSTEMQLDQMLPYACNGNSRGGVRGLFLFVTSLTVDMHFRAAVKKAKLWWKEPRLGTLISERIARRVEEHSPSVKRIVLTDDVHYVRARQAFSDVRQPLHVEYMLAWLKRREFDIYEAADYVLTVSSEDADTIKTELHARRPDIESARFRPESPSVRWAPFVYTEILRNLSIPMKAPTPLRNRTGLVFVGMPHPVAVPSIKWLVDSVLPELVRILGDEYNQSTKFVEAQAKLYLGGGGEVMAHRWQQVVRGAPKNIKRRVKLLGALSDQGLTNHLTRWRRVYAAPIFNNTGISTKVVNAMSYGIPVVTTPSGTRGLGLPRDHDHLVQVAEDAHDFARRTARLLVDDSLWQEIAKNAALHVRETLSEDALTKVVADAMAAVNILTSADEISGAVHTRYIRPDQHLASASRPGRIFLNNMSLANPTSTNFQGQIIVAGRRPWDVDDKKNTPLGERDAFEVAFVSPDSGQVIKSTVIEQPLKELTACKKRRGKKKKMRRPRGVDELRLFVWRDSLWLIFVASAFCPPVKDDKQMKHDCTSLCALDAVTYLLLLDPDTGRPVSIPRPIFVAGSPLGPNQRGLSPLVYKDELFLSFSIEPHALLSVRDFNTDDLMVRAQLTTVAVNDELWRDMRALDGGCLTKLPILPATPAIRISNDEFLMVIRTQLELGCLRFYEHYAITFEAKPPFLALRRSIRPLPLASRSFAPARANECRANEAYRVRSGRAKSAAGLFVLEESATNNKTILISYSAGNSWQFRSLAIPWNELDAHLLPHPPEETVLLPCPANRSKQHLPPECLVQAEYAAQCAASRNKRRRDEFLGLFAEDINGELSAPAELYRPFLPSPQKKQSSPNDPSGSFSIPIEEER